jgi:hypothetical protein
MEAGSDHLTIAQKRKPPMSQPQFVSLDPRDPVNPAPTTNAPNHYQLTGGGVSISYYPGGMGPVFEAGGQVVLNYQDTQRSLTFRSDQVTTVTVPDLGTCVTVTLSSQVLGGSTTATLLIPTVALAPVQSATVDTVLITTVDNGIHPVPESSTGPTAADTQPGPAAPDDSQREHYAVTTLTGDANVELLPM